MASPTVPGSRKTVTVVFCDLSESVALGERLDPERLHQVLSRYYEAVARVLEAHGGTVEKFIGDAAVAIFGVPLLSEDDAVRAVAAALELREAVDLLNEGLEAELDVRISVHVGVNTGEVFTAPASHGIPIATGDAVNVAARLQQFAVEGEILIGEATYRLVAETVEAERLEPLAVKGREESVGAWRLLGRAGETPAFSGEPRAPFVNRAHELRELSIAFERAVGERECRLCTIVGPPGLGKSRLGREFVESLGSRTQVLVGRCVPYGEGLTYRPLADMVRQLRGDPRERIAELIPRDDHAATVADAVLGAVGMSAAVSSKEEVFWAVRKLVEALAAQRPLIVAFEDVHWAEPTLLELVEHLLAFTRDAPVLLLCLARPEFLDSQPAWAAPRATSTVLPLEPFSDDHARQLVELLPSGRDLPLRAAGRVIESAEGNPLYIEQLVALQAETDGDDGTSAIPPGIQALLSARIDRLAASERTVLERASIEGRTFHLDGLAELLPAEIREHLDAHLLALVRKELIRPGQADIPGADAFRFRHMLIRDAAYGSMPKQSRADLHERFAQWFESAAADRLPESEEIIGYHLEAACAYRRELGAGDALLHELAGRAAGWLRSAGRGALARGDAAGAVNLLERAAELEDDVESGETLVDLASALRGTGDLGRTEEVLRTTLDLAERTGDRRLEALALVERTYLGLYTKLAGGAERLVQVSEDAVRVFEEVGEDSGLSKALCLLASKSFMRCQLAETEVVLERALVHAERAGDRRQELTVLNWLAHVALVGPTPVVEALDRCAEFLERAPTMEAALSTDLAYLHAMQGRFDEARRLYAHSHTLLEDLGRVGTLASSRTYSGTVELLAGDPVAAEMQLRAGLATLESLGDRGNLATTAAFLAEALLAQDRQEEAEQFAETSRETAFEDDVMTQIAWRCVLSRVRAYQGALDVAVSMARVATALADQTDYLNIQGNAFESLAAVLRVDGRPDGAAEAADRAVSYYEAKGNVVAAARAREAGRAVLDA